MVRTRFGVLSASLVPLAFALCVACAAASADEPQMVPYLDYGAFPSSGKRLRIDPVEAHADAYAKQSVWTGELPRIEVKPLEQALAETLRKSNLFLIAEGSAPAELVLRTRILGHRILPGVTMTSLLFVRYDLVDAATEQSLWNENVLVQYHGYGAKADYANNAAARKSLTRLLSRLEQWVLQPAASPPKN
jgi:hypothetical protein